MTRVKPVKAWAGVNNDRIFDVEMGIFTTKKKTLMFYDFAVPVMITPTTPIRRKRK